MPTPLTTLLPHLPFADTGAVQAHRAGGGDTAAQAVDDVAATHKRVAAEATPAGERSAHGGTPATGDGKTVTARPPFAFAPTEPYAFPADGADLAVRARLPQPGRPLPPSQAADHPAHTKGGALDALATPHDAKLTGLPALIQSTVAPVSLISQLAGAPLGILGLQTPLATAVAGTMDNPITTALLTPLAELAGMAFGTLGGVVGEDVIRTLTATALNSYSSEVGGAGLASPAGEEMAVGVGWQGILDGLVSNNSGLNWYSTNMLGVLKNRTGGGTGPEFYKQLVVDTWDQQPGGREFLSSVGRSAMARPTTAGAWFSEYYYDVLDQEDGTGRATKIVDTLDYRFGLDAGVMNAIYKDGEARASAVGRAFPAIAADLAGDPSVLSAFRQYEKTGKLPGQDTAQASAGTGTHGATDSQRGAGARGDAAPAATIAEGFYNTTKGAPITAGGLSPANASTPTGPELSASTSETRAYRNGSQMHGPGKQLGDQGLQSVLGLAFGLVPALTGGLFGKQGNSRLFASFFAFAFSGDRGGTLAGAFLRGAQSAPGGDQAVSGLLKGVLSSSGGTAFTITAMQQISKDPSGVSWFRELLAPLQHKDRSGVSALDRLLSDARRDPVMANNLRAIADETLESGSATNMLESIGLKDWMKTVQERIPTASKYAYLETSPTGHLPLTDRRRLEALFANPVKETPALFDENGKTTPFANVGLRMLGHDILDGRLDGDVALRALYNPKGSDNADLRGSIELVKKWGELDLHDDGRINGSVYRDLVMAIDAQTGSRYGEQLEGMPLSNAVLDERSLLKDLPSSFDFVNLKVNTGNYRALAAQYGLTPTQLTDVVLWGHMAFKFPGDPAQAPAVFDQIVRGALAGDQTSTFDAMFVRDVPGVRAHLQSLVGDFDGFQASAMYALGRIYAHQARH